MKKINLDDIIEYLDFGDNVKFDVIHKGYEITMYTKEAMKLAIKEACQQTLKLAAENAYAIGKGSNLTTRSGGLKWTFAGHIGDVEIDKQSILDTINQVE